MRLTALNAETLSQGTFKFGIDDAEPRGKKKKKILSYFFFRLGDDENRKIAGFVRTRSKSQNKKKKRWLGRKRNRETRIGKKEWMGREEGSGKPGRKGTPKVRWHEESSDNKYLMREFSVYYS